MNSNKLQLTQFKNGFWAISLKPKKIHFYKNLCLWWWPDTETLAVIKSDLANINGIKLEMIYIPGGTFLMGSPNTEAWIYDREGPQHQVTLKSFYMSKYPITQEQYQIIMGYNPSRFNEV